MFCTTCGTKNSEDGNFCKQCGLRLDRPVSPRFSEQDFERAMPEDDQLTALLERAYRARKDGDRLGAIAICLEALKLRPLSTSCHSLLGQLYEQGGERDLAILEYERVLELNPGSIADRVKLDELKGEVPALVTEKRQTPQIVLADRGKATAPPDYRIPAFIMAAAALMILGGIFTMQFLAHQREISRTTAANQYNNGRGAANTNSAQPVTGNQQTGASPEQQASQQSGPQGNGFSLFSGQGQQPIIIQTPTYTRPPDLVYSPGPGSTPQTARQLVDKSAGATDPDVGSEHVHLSGLKGDDGASGVGSLNGNATAQPNKNDKVSLSPGNASGGTQAPAVGTDTSTSSSESHKNMARADLLAVQGQYKPAGTIYLQALDGAGEDTAYVYRRAAWCFEKAGEKTTAVNCYHHGIDEAQKLLASGKQVEHARNLIRECETGIKVCSN